MNRWCGRRGAACGLVAGLAVLGCTTGDGGAGYRLTAQTGQLKAVTATGTGFVAVGYDSQDALVLTSADAVTWTREALPALANIGLVEGFLFDVAAGNGIVVAVGDDGMQECRMAFSRGARPRASGASSARRVSTIT